MPTLHSPLRFRIIALVCLFLLPFLAISQIPENDDPCPTDSNPPIDLTSTGTDIGTTCEATFDYANVDCSSDTELASVWYTYTPNSADDGYDVTLASANGGNDAEGPITMELYLGTTNQGCSGFSAVMGSSCSSINSSLSIPNNFSAGEILYIKVTTNSAEVNCGEFMISVSPGDCGSFADECSEMTAAQTMSPTTNDQFQISYNCLSGCITYANPDASASDGCDEFATNPTVWYKVNTDAQAQQLYTTVVPNGNWDAVWSIYGGDDCSALEIMISEGNSCSNEDVTPELFQIAVTPEYTTYWIAVTVDPNSVPIGGIDDGSFEICVATTINGIVCLGSLEGDCAEPTLVIEVTERELEGQSLDGPFCPGEEVSIHVSFFFDASETSSDWLSGIVPRFGPGWNLENFDYNAVAPIGNGSTAEWLEEGGPCAPAISEDVPHLCTYTDENGNLALCNNLCESCSECPSSLGMTTGDPLPSGYFWVSNGGSAGCDNDCSPQEGWGIGAVTVQVEWDFTLKVKDYVDYETCFTNNDLQISFQSFSQGVVGCWEDPIGECLIDKSQFGPLWKVECILPPVVEGENQEICSDDLTSIELATIDGSTNKIIVEAQDNPNVTGEMDHEFFGGSGIVFDNLINNTNTVQTVTYWAYSEDLTVSCAGNITTIEVIVYPELILDLDGNYVCEGECTSINYEVSGGTGQPYTYEWSTGAVSPIIEVCPLVATTYSATVTDANGCTAVDDVIVNVVPPVDMLLPELVQVCKDDNFDPDNPDYMVCIDFLSGNPPYEVSWNADIGLVGIPTGLYDGCFIINELASSEFGGDNGVYELSVVVSDESGCIGETSTQVSIQGELTLVLGVSGLECGETEAIINATGLDAAGAPVTNFLIYGGCPNDGSLGDFLDEESASSGSTQFEIDLLNYTCYEIIGQTENGCQVSEKITINILDGIPIDIVGTTNVCQGEEATITINNPSDFISFMWSPDIGSTGSVTFIPDSTVTYIVEATDATGCTSQEMFTVIVNDADGPLCADPCENQISDFQITGIAYSDDNGNGVKDIGELPLSNILIKDVQNDFTVFTNVFGVYVIAVEEGDIDLQASTSQGDWVDSEIDQTVNVNIPCVENINFGFVPSINEYNANISVSNTIARCDFETKFYITVENQNHETVNGRVEFKFDNKTTFFMSDINGIQVSNNTASFDTGPLLGFTPKTFVITLKMPGGSSVLPLLDFTAKLYEDELLLDTYTYSDQLRCSYDPNDKRTFPDRDGDENPTLKEETLEYTIRFQNNGNDTAFHVRVVDVMDPNIIRSTIRFISSSHPYEACISGDSLIIDFENIMLVDSMTNYEASQGYVSFSCQVDPTVALDTEINNTADIIFDTNPPIVTNTTLNTIVDMLCSNVTIDIAEVICLGESFMGFDSPGFYQVIQPTELGCDSIFDIALEVITPIQSELFEAILCQGDDFEVNGMAFEIEESGTYAFEIEGEFGCIGEIINVEATVIETDEIFEAFTICNGDAIVYDGEEYLIEESGIHQFEKVSPEGCLIQLLSFDVVVISTEEVFETFTICDGDLIDYGGQEYEIEESGTYQFEVISPEGCLDKLLNFDVTIISISQTDLDFELCENEVVTYENEEYSFDSSGTYSYILQGPTGCDEIELVFDISIFETVHTNLDTTICEGQSYKGLEESGVYTLESPDPITGCASFETVTLTVLPLSDPACTTATEDELLNDIVIFPIPASNDLFIRSEIKLENIIIMSATGKVVLKLDNQSANEVKLDVSELPNGFHFIMIEPTKEE